MQEFEIKQRAALEELANTGIWTINYMPPIYKVFSKIGLKIRPPHYASFIHTCLFSALWFGLAWGLLMWFFLWSGQSMPAWVAVSASIIGGTLFGLGMALYYRRSRLKHNLTPWHELVILNVNHT